jgi:glycosyltransferase involved in cell wall biosynthesis
MRIAHYMTGLHERGGIRTHIRLVSETQRQAGHDVLLFDLQEFQQRDGGGFEHVQYVADESALLAEAERRGVDILHAHTLVERAAESKVPVLRSLHGHEPYCLSGGHYLARQQIVCSRRYHPIGCTWGHLVDRCGSARPLNLLADLRRTRAELRSTIALNVLTVSEYLRTQMIRNGYDAARIHTLYPPAPPPRPWAPPPEHFRRFVFIGRITPQKGVDWFLQSAVLAKEDFAIDIAGDGNAMAAVKKLAKASSRSITFHGWLDHLRLEALLRGCRAVVVPSLWPEPAGLVTLEAMAHGRPVIAAANGGLPEVVGEQAGLLVPPGNVPALAAALDRLASEHDTASRIGQAGQERVSQHFTLEGHLQKLMDFYRKAIEDWRR